MTRRVLERLCPEKVCIDFPVPNHWTEDYYITSRYASEYMTFDAM